jgi:hypothetical protein
VSRLLPGGIDQLGAAFRDARLAAFVAQPFLASGFYDVLPIYPLTATFAALLRIPFEKFLREGSFEQARYDAAHVFLRMYDGAGIDDLPERIIRFEGQYYDFGRTEVKAPASGVFVLCRHEVPEYVAPWLTSMKAGYSEEVARIVGASRPHCTALTPVPTGERSGYPLVSVMCELRWSDAAS